MTKPRKGLSRRIWMRKRSSFTFWKWIKRQRSCRSRVVVTAVGYKRWVTSMVITSVCCFLMFLSFVSHYNIDPRSFHANLYGPKLSNFVQSMFVFFTILVAISFSNSLLRNFFSLLNFPVFLLPCGLQWKDFLVMYWMMFPAALCSVLRLLTSDFVP